MKTITVNYPCLDCAVQKRGGPLPCHYGAEFDMLMISASSPKAVIIECPHYIPVDNPADQIEWIE